MAPVIAAWSAAVQVVALRASTTSRCHRTASLFKDPWNSLGYWQSLGEGRARSAPYSPHPRAVECPSRRFQSPDFSISKLQTNESQKGGANLFVELMPLLKQRTLLITVARIDEKPKVNVVPAKAKEGEDEALTTPLSYTGSPEELKEETATPLAALPDATPSCFQHKPKLTNLAQSRVRPKGVRQDGRKTVISQLHLQRCQASGSRSENDGGRGEEPLQPPVSRIGNGCNLSDPRRPESGCSRAL